MAWEEREAVRLPGELPPAFRRRHGQQTHQSAQPSLCLSSADVLAAEVRLHVLQQEDQRMEINEVKGDLFKVIDRLDDVIERLMKSCKVKPNIELPIDTGTSVEESFSSKVLESRLDRIIEKLSQSGYFSRLSKDLCATPLREYIANEKPSCSIAKLSSTLSPMRTCRILAKADDDDTLLERDNIANEMPTCNSLESSSTLSPLKMCEILGKAHDDDDQVKNPTTPMSSSRMPLLTPRCLLSKFGSSEKVDSFASPTTSGRLSSGRSGRFSAALSFLVSPRRGGSLLSIIPIPPDSHLER